MNRKELLCEIEHALNYVQRRSEEVKEIKEEFKKLQQDLDKLETLEKEKEWFEETIKQWGEKYCLLEKELLQTKKNFRNSQTHSKNCYKKLKRKYNEVEFCYEKLSKDHMSLKKSFDELFETYISVTRRLEQFEKENQELKDKTKELEVLNENLNKYIDNFRQNANIQDLNRLQEIYKLEKALEKACERLDYTCPVEEELIEDLNCENCKDNYKECWVKFFLKGALKNE